MKAGVWFAGVVDAIVEQRAVGAEPQVRADLHGEQDVGKIATAQYAALKLEESLPGGDGRAGENPAAIVRRQPNLEFRAVHGPTNSLATGSLDLQFERRAKEFLQRLLLIFLE